MILNSRAVEFLSPFRALAGGSWERADRLDIFNTFFQECQHVLDCSLAGVSSCEAGSAGRGFGTCPILKFAVYCGGPFWELLGMFV